MAIECPHQDCPHHDGVEQLCSEDECKVPVLGKLQFCPGCKGSEFMVAEGFVFCTSSSQCSWSKDLKEG